MPKPKGSPGPMKGPKRNAQRLLPGTPLRDDRHWFDHPEMQARIAEAEADRREGRVTRMDTPEAIEAYLNSLG
jgi:hypothetical protein